MRTAITVILLAVVFIFYTLSRQEELLEITIGNEIQHMEILNKIRNKTTDEKVKSYIDSIKTESKFEALEVKGKMDSYKWSDLKSAKDSLNVYIKTCEIK